MAGRFGGSYPDRIRRRVGRGQSVIAVPFQSPSVAKLSRQEKVEICAKSVLRQDGVPPFQAHAYEVMAHTLDPESSSTELTRLVLRDVGLTSHVLRIANSAMYNHSGRPILNVRHAIAMLGWQSIHSLVSTVRYIEHFSSWSPGIRELVLLSVLTASHSREVAQCVGYDRPEEAYVCGLLRNLGEVLLACYQPEEYSRILVTMHEEKVSDRAAALRELDFGWDDLACSVSKGWNMPPKVRLCLESPKSTGNAQDNSLISIANYGHGLTQSIYRDGARFEEVHLRTVLSPSGQPALIAVKDLRRIIDSAEYDTKGLFAGLNVPVDQLRLDRQVEKARGALSVSGAREAMMNRAVLDQAVQGAKRAVVGGEFDLTGLIRTILGSLQEAGFDRCVFGFVTADSSRIRGRLGAGLAAEGLIESFDFPVATFPLDDRFDDGTLLVQQFGAASFVLLPVIVQRKLAGCLYADTLRPKPGLEHLRPSLCRVRDLITSAIRKKIHARAVA